MTELFFTTCYVRFSENIVITLLRVEKRRKKWSRYEILTVLVKIVMYWIVYSCIIDHLNCTEVVEEQG